MRRISSIDITRGLVMIIMALDHTRDFLHLGSQTHNPTDLTTTTPLFFFTRWITHLCAPAFVFLSGISASISLKNSAGDGRAGTTRPDGRTGQRFLLSRGLWLLVVEFTLVNFGLSFDVRFRLLLFEVIAAIGSGFFLLSYLSRLPRKVLLVITATIIFAHDLIAFIPMPSNPVLGFLGSLLFGPGSFQLTPDRLFLIAYPIIPWLGIMLAGFLSAPLLELPVLQRKRIWRRMGLAVLLLFLLIRGINIYGDPTPWSMQKKGIFTILSFLNVGKYPPSLLFTLLMGGLLFCILTLVEGRDNRFTRILTVYGRTPLFYFLLHLYLIHGITLVVVLLQGYPAADLPFGPFQFGRPKGSGLSLASVYGIWVGVVVVLYPLCRWYGNYKSAHKEKKWLRYL